MRLDLSSLKKAIASLEIALGVFAAATKGEREPGMKKVLRAGVIQSFEFTYEISHKMLKRHLEAVSTNPAEIDELSFPDLIRTASEKGLLLHGWDIWRDYREMRNITSHTYNEYKAEEVFAVVPGFLEEAQYLMTKLEQNNPEAD